MDLRDEGKKLRENLGGGWFDTIIRIGACLGDDMERSEGELDGMREEWI